MLQEKVLPPVPVVVPELERLISDLIKKFIPIDRAHLENYPVSANGDIPSTPISPINPPCTFRIMIATSTSGVLSAVIRVGDSIHELKLFEGANLMPDCLYLCGINVHEGDRITLRYSVDTVIRVLRIQELRL